MTGAMAGSATIRFRGRRGSLRVVTLTVNNCCNLSCPHCYLQYNGPNTRLSADLASLLVAEQFEHLAIVGKEPLADAASARVSNDLIVNASAAGKTVSLITNGFGLPRLSRQAASLLSWLDVSLDGGPATYSRYRRGSYSKLLSILRSFTSDGSPPLNILHTLSDATLSSIEDMMAVEADLDLGKMVFSPYVDTRNDGSNSVNSLSLPLVLDALADSPSFMSSRKSVLLLGAKLIVSDADGLAALCAQLSDRDLTDKTILVEHDPLFLGFLRVTYDGLVLAPSESLHPTDYITYGTRIREHGDLGRSYRSLVECERVH